MVIKHKEIKVRLVQFGKQPNLSKSIPYDHDYQYSMMLFQWIYHNLKSRFSLRVLAIQIRNLADIIESEFQCIHQNERNTKMKHLRKNGHQWLSKVTALLLFTALSFNSVSAQYMLDEKVSFIYVNGTSTLHDWTASVEQMKGSLEAEVENNHLVKIYALRISTPTNSLRSGKEGMDKNMHEALKSANYPEIIYRINSHTIHNGTITSEGHLTIAGVTKKIETKVTQTEAGKHIKVDGEVKLKMSDFKIKPPEFLFGSFRTGDEITIVFHFMFCRNS